MGWGIEVGEIEKVGRNIEECEVWTLRGKVFVFKKE